METAITTDVDTTVFYTKEDVQGWTVVKKCTECKFAVFTGKSQDVNKSTNTINEVFDNNHNCIIF